MDRTRRIIYWIELHNKLGRDLYQYSLHNYICTCNNTSWWPTQCLQSILGEPQQRYTHTHTHTICHSISHSKLFYILWLILQSYSYNAIHSHYQCIRTCIIGLCCNLLYPDILFCNIHDTSVSNTINTAIYANIVMTIIMF